MISSNRQAEITRVVRAVDDSITRGEDTVVYTSRKTITGTDGDEYLKIGDIVSSSLVDIVRNMNTPPRFIVAKGGITSSVLATEALECKSALVLGQVIPGVPVWELGAESLQPGMPYVVFPGNVGDDYGLVSVLDILAN